MSPTKARKAGFEKRVHKLWVLFWHLGQHLSIVYFQVDMCQAERKKCDLRQTQMFKILTTGKPGICEVTKTVGCKNACAIICS